jgi:hypothetical protein
LWFVEDEEKTGGFSTYKEGGGQDAVALVIREIPPYKRVTLCRIKHFYGVLQDECNN